MTRQTWLGRLVAALTPTPPVYVVWYREPRREQGWRSYLLLDEENGSIYIREADKATTWPSASEAARHVPCYDGSSGIESRTGVEVRRG